MIKVKQLLNKKNNPTALNQFNNQTPRISKLQPIKDEGEPETTSDKISSKLSMTQKDHSRSPKRKRKRHSSEKKKTVDKETPDKMSKSMPEVEIPRDDQSESRQSVMKRGKVKPDHRLIAKSHPVNYTRVEFRDLDINDMDI